jgi:vacuolar-type H+-ATPase subunit H
MTSTPRTPAPPEVAGATAAQVSAILAAAEEVATEVREQAERRARDRISEADRAAELRVLAAEQEAREILEEAVKDAARRRAAADGYAAEIRAGAAAEASDLVGAARAVAADVREHGLDLSSDIRDLSRALRTNAERLLKDIKQAHARMTADLDEVDPSPRRPGRRSAAERAADTPRSPARS